MKPLGLLFTLLLPLTAVVETSTNPAPCIIGTPPADAGRGLIRVSPTEIRHYSGDKNRLYYWVSTDNGKTGSEKEAPASYPPNFGGISNESPAITWLPLQKKWIRIQPVNGFIFLADDIDGKWFAVTQEGQLEPDWNDKEKQKKFKKLGGIMRSPTVVNKGKRILIPTHDKNTGTSFHISDDGGLTWKRSKGTIKTPPYTPKKNDKGVRWNNAGVESSVVELKNGKIWAVVRTDQNHHWQSFSSDKGNTWPPPQPSPFYGTLTMITIGRLQDGRLIALWSNTAPLPEVKHGANSNWEDVFTNRDAHHIALSVDEGKTWIGFREIYLNPNRNDRDYGDTGGSDRGSHQSEFIDLKDGSLLISVGQHPKHRKLIRVPLKWVEEKTQETHFEKNLDDWTYHTYIPQKRGHCAYNRLPSAQLVPAPNSQSKALKICFNDNPLLINSKIQADYRAGGATWNFPAGQSGELSLSFLLNKNSGGVYLSLCDRLFNACDLSAPEQSAYTVKLAPGLRLGKTLLEPDRVYTLKMVWNKNKPCQLFLNGVAAENLKLQNPVLNGLSYLHLISAAQSPDSGILIIGVAVKVK